METMASKNEKKAVKDEGFDEATLGASEGDALAVVKKTPEARQEKLVAAWLAKGNVAAIAAVAREDAAPSAARKAARRALPVLKSRGIAVPDRAPSVVSFTSKAEVTMEARCIFPDGRGAQMWWIARIESTGRVDVVEVTTMDRAGIMNVSRGNPTAGKLKQVFHGWHQRVGRTPVVVPLDYARHRIAVARAQSVARKQVLPMGLDAAKDLLLGETGKAPAAPAKHPIELEDLAVPTEETAVKARIASSMHLHEEPEFGSWLPEDSAAVELLKTVNERVNGIPEAERDAERIDKVVNAAVDEAADVYFSAERKGLYLGRILDSAWSLYRSERIDRAIDALVVAGAIDRAGIVSDRPSEIPFVRGMFIKLLAVAQQRAAAGV